MGLNTRVNPSIWDGQTVGMLCYVAHILCTYSCICWAHVANDMLKLCHSYQRVKTVNWITNHLEDIM